MQGFHETYVLVMTGMTTFILPALQQKAQVTSTRDASDREGLVAFLVKRTLRGTSSQRGLNIALLVDLQHLITPRANPNVGTHKAHLGN